MGKKICLNLGCGPDYRESTEEERWVNVDKGDCKVDIELDLEEVPYLEFQSEEFDHIEAIQVLEHLPRKLFADVVRELYRISASGAIWHIAVPHGFSDNFITDPTHQMAFSTRTFDYFVDGTDLRDNGRIYGWADVSLRHHVRPALDANQSIHFNLEVIK